MWQLAVLLFSVVVFGGLGWYLSPCAEVRMRYIGLGFELAGITTVALGLLERHGLFGIPPPFEAAWHRLKKWWRPKSYVITAGTGSLRMQGSTVVGRGAVSCGPGASLEQRVSALESNMVALAKEQGEFSTALSQETAKREEQLASERKVRNEADKELQNKLQELGAGNLHLEWMGILFLLFGVILATTSDELARFFSNCP